MTVRGKVEYVPAPPQNPDDYGKMLTEAGLPIPASNAWGGGVSGNTRTMKGGAAAE